MDTTHNTAPEPNGTRTIPGWLRVALALVVIVGLFALFRFFDVQAGLTATLDWIRAQGVLAPVIFVALYIIATVFFVPGTLLTLGAGVLFGVVYGSIYVSIGSTVGASFAFLAGRYLMRDTVAGWLETRENFRAIDEAVAQEGWKIVGLTRLSPIFPFNLLNYAFGVTRVSFWQYVLASWIGMMPATVLYVWVGSAAGNLATLGEGEGRSGAEQTFFYVGLVATLAVTVYVTQIARRALKKKIDPSA